MIRTYKQKNGSINFSKAAVLIMINILSPSCKGHIESENSRVNTIDASNNTGVIQKSDSQEVLKRIGDRLIENDGSKAEFERYMQTNPSIYELEYIEKSLKEIENREALHFGFESTEEGLLAIEFSGQKLSTLRLKAHETIYDFGIRLKRIIESMVVGDIVLFDIGEKGFKLRKIEYLEKHMIRAYGNMIFAVESTFNKLLPVIKENEYSFYYNPGPIRLHWSFQELLEKFRIFLDELRINSKAEEEKAKDTQLFFEKRYDIE